MKMQKILFICSFVSVIFFILLLPSKAFAAVTPYYGPSLPAGYNLVSDTFCTGFTGICYNNEAIGVTDCGTGCSGGTLWTKHTYNGCYEDALFDGSFLAWSPPTSAVCSTADKCIAGENVLRYGSCTCGIYGPASGYKYCCSASGNSETCNSVGNIDNYFPDEGTCPGGYIIDGSRVRSSSCVLLLPGPPTATAADPWCNGTTRVIDFYFTGGSGATSHQLRYGVGAYSDTVQGTGSSPIRISGFSPNINIYWNIWACNSSGCTADPMGYFIINTGASCAVAATPTPTPTPSGSTACPNNPPNPPGGTNTCQVGSSCPSGTNIYGSATNNDCGAGMVCCNQPAPTATPIPGATATPIPPPPPGCTSPYQCNLNSPGSACNAGTGTWTLHPGDSPPGTLCPAPPYPDSTSCMICVANPTPTPIPTFSISGTAWVDTNRNGARDGTEVSYTSSVTGYAGQATVLRAGPSSGSTLTGSATGNYSFTSLSSGAYTITLNPPVGWASTSTNPRSISVGPSIAGINFGITIIRQCEDGVDNDSDGVIDSADSGCHTDGNPNNPGSYTPGKDSELPRGTECSDNIDNDGDGLIDGGDPECQNPPGTWDPNIPSESPPPTCTGNLISNPSTLQPGGTSDLNIGGCDDVEDPPDEEDPPPFDWDPPVDDNPTDEGTSECSDVIDNDGDGKIDTDDPRCHWDGDSDNPGSYDPKDDNELPRDGNSGQCADGVDNDMDGAIDIADPECHTDGNPDNPGSYDPTDDNESDRVGPGESGSTTCPDGGLVVNTVTSTSSNATWTAPFCPTVDLICTISVTAGGPGGTSPVYSTTVNVNRSGIIQVSIHDVTDGSTCNADAPLYTDDVAVQLAGPVNTTETVTDGTYDFVCLPDGNYTVAMGLPPGYQMSSPDKNSIDNIEIDNNTQTARFCITNFEPWYQTTQGDIKMRGIVNPIPAGKYGSIGENASSPQFSKYPGIFYSTRYNSVVSAGGRVSDKGWAINSGYAYNSLTQNRNGTLAYSFYKSRARQEGIPITALGIENIDFTMNATNIPTETGIYEVNADLTINDYTHTPNKRITLLVSGDVFINTEIYVPVGGLFIIASKGNIIIPESLGHASPGFNTTASNLEGYYSAEKSIILEGTKCTGAIPDRRLNVAGALVANALKPFASNGEGTIQNNRSLCTNDDLYPSLYVSSRPDFLTKLTDFYKVSYTKWREVRP